MKILKKHEFADFIAVFDSLYESYSKNELDLETFVFNVIDSYQVFLKRNPDWRRYLIKKDLEAFNEKK